METAMSYEFKQCSEELNEIGEGPLWHSDMDSLYWIDVGLKPLKLYQYNVSTEKTQVFQLPSRASSIRLRKDGNLILGFQKGLAIFNVQTHEITHLEVQGINFSEERLNDSAADSKGRLWIGSFDRQLKNNLGRLYKIDTSLQAQSMDDSMMMSNGIAWSPDDKTLYFCDSRPGKIYAYDFDIENGTIANKRVFMDFAGRTGRPDGCAMDQDGFLWVAEIDASQLLKIRNDSFIEEEIHLPVKKPTSLTFGGKNLDTLFITSMTFGLTDEEKQSQPLSGKLFSCKVNSKGKLENTI
jgi:sugar lactone lactonase YvrE